MSLILDPNDETGLFSTPVSLVYKTGKVAKLSYLVAAKPSNSSRGELSPSFFFLLLSHEVQKKVQTVQTNMVAYVVWAINFKSEVRSDLRGCLEAIGASKPHFLCWVVSG